MLPGGKVRPSEHNSELTARDFVLQISANIAMFHILAAVKLVSDELLLLLRILILAREFSRLEIIGVKILTTTWSFTSIVHRSKICYSDVLSGGSPRRNFHQSPLPRHVASLTVT